MLNILITGTSSGIGLASAVELARRGHRVFASMRDLGRSGPLEEAVAAASTSVELVPLDVQNSDSVQAAVAHVLGVAGSIDVLVNNAAVMSVRPLEFTTEREFEDTLDTNVTGPFRLIRAVLPSMRAQGHGRIVNISSTAAHPRLGFRLWGAYAASKAALAALSMELVKEVSPLGLEVVLMEGGVWAQTPSWEPVAREAVAFAPETSPYRLAERIAQEQIGFASGAGSPAEEVAKMVADACTIPAPPLRYPADLQVGVDAADRIADDVFVRLARGEDDGALYDGVPGFWAMQKALLES